VLCYLELSADQKVPRRLLFEHDFVVHISERRNKDTAYVLLIGPLVHRSAPKGAAICETYGITGFKRVRPQLFDDLISKFGDRSGSR